MLSILVHILYYSKYYYEVRKLDFEAFKVAVTQDTGLEKMDIKAFLKERQYGKDINYIKRLVQKQKESLKVE